MFARTRPLSNVPSAQHCIQLLVIWSLLLALVLPAFHPPIATAALATVYVRADGDDTNCNGSADAAAAAAPNCAVRSIARGVALVASGGTVRVAAGDYAGSNGNVVINGSNITLSGPNADVNPVIGARAAEAVLSGAARFTFTEGVQNVTVQGFKMSNIAGLAFHLDGATSGVTIKNNLVDTTSDTAIFAASAYNQSNLRILNNTIQNVQGVDHNGIFILWISSGEISGNLIDTTTYGGILVDGATNLSIANNSVANVPKQGIQVANTIPANPTANVTVTQNVVTRANTSNDADRGAIRLYSTNGPINVSNNLISDSFNGIAIRNSSIINGITARYNDMTSLSGGSAMYHGGSGTLDAAYNYAGGNPPSTAGSGAITVSAHLTTLSAARSSSVPAGSLAFEATLQDQAAAPVAGALLRYTISPAPGNNPAQGTFTTGSDGKAAATLPNVPDGSYNIVVSSAGPTWFTQPGGLSSTFSFQAGNTGTGRVSGRVTNRSDGTGLPLVQMCLEPSFSSTPECDYTTNTDAFGNYQFTGLPDGAYTLSPRSTGNFAPTQRIVVIGFGDVTADFYVPIPHTWTKTEEIAHRGDVLSAPENTDTAINRALNKQASYIELDVYLSNENRVIVSHGSDYKPLPTLPGDIPSQVYGPTTACQGENTVETSPWTTMSTCDIGSDMKHPRFVNERFPLLADVLQRNSGYAGWMVELKETEIAGLSAEQKAERNRRLGQEAARLLQQAGRSDVWVTSFNDDCLQGAADILPNIKRMRQVKINPLNQGAVWEVDNAIIRGYSALNIDSGMLDDTIFPGVGPTWADYIHSKGLLVSAYRLALSGVSIIRNPAPTVGQNPGDNSEVISSKADFFMTDILDDLMVKNGDKNPPKTPQTLTIQPGDNVVIRNNEVFPITAAVKALNSGGAALPSGGGIEIPPLGWVVMEFRASGFTRVRVTVPDYASNGTVSGYRVTYDSNNTVGGFPPFLPGAAQLEVTAQHKDYENVEPWFVLGKDRITFRANGVRFPDPAGRNRAIVGNECIRPGEPRVAKTIKLKADISVEPTWASDPSVGVPPQPRQTWIENIRFYIDGELIGEEGGGMGLTSATLPIGGPEIRDLAEGEHTFRMTYTVRHDEIPERVRDEVVEEKFTVKVKEIDPTTGKCGDVQVAFVVDTTGSMGGAIGNVRNSLTQVTNELANKNSFRAAVVEYKDARADAFGARIVLPFSSDTAAITGAINSLSAAGGGDGPEDVHTGLITAINGLSWNNDLPKTIVLIGDAPPNTSDPVSQSSVIMAANAAGIRILAIPLGGEAASSFAALADGTNGAVLDANASTIVAAILDAINNNVE